MASPYSSFFVSTPSPYDQTDANAVAGPSSSTSDRPSSKQRAASSSFDYYSNYGLDPAAFQTDVTFQMPSFLTAAGPFAQPPPPPSGPSFMDATSLPFAFASPPAQGSGPSRSPQSPSTYTPSPTRPVYGPYGSSFVGVNADARPFPAENPPSAKAAGKARAPDFDPATLGLPRAVGGNFPGLYSVSGFDMLGVLARVAARPNPQVNIGPVDLSTALIVVDARRYDLPIVYASDTFSTLTGYPNAELIGRNCRMLQSPPGTPINIGQPRTTTDSNAVYHMKAHIQSGKECQSSVVNYRKDGTPFVNLVTIIPICWESDEVAYYVGFQIDVVNQPNLILERMKAGTYTVNYSLVQTDRSYLEHVAGDPQAASTPGAGGDDIASLQREATRHLKTQPPAAGGDGLLGRAAERQLSKLSITPAAVTDSSVAYPFPGAVMPPPTGLAGDVPVVADLLSEAAKGKSGDGRKLSQWHKQLVEECDDLVLVTNLNGVVIYASPSSTSTLDYSPNELVGQSLYDLVHSADAQPILRELKTLSGAKAEAKPLSLLYRMKRKSAECVWIEASGRMRHENGKQHILLVGRQRPLYSLSRSTIKSEGGHGPVEFWSKVTYDGMFLHVTPSVEAMLGFSAPDMTGFTIFQLSPDGDPSRLELAQALDRARARQPARVNHVLRNAQGENITVSTTFYTPLVSGEVITPLYILTRTATTDSENARQVASLNAIPLGALAASHPVHTLFTPLKGTGNGGGASENVFEELDVNRQSNWQSELSALTKSNKKLAEERKLLSTLLQRRRRHTSYNALSLDGGREEDADGDFDYDERSSDASAPLAMLPLPAVAPASDEGGETSDEDYML